MITRNSRGTKRFTATAAAAAVVASTLAISGSAAAVVGVATDRIGGDNRYDTAGLIADEAFTAPVADILLASGLVFADALAGNALAGTIDGPILLTDPDSLSADTAASIQALSGPGTTVHILGETAAVSAAVEAEVAALGVATNRFGGDDRFDTAAEIAEFVDANATIPGLNETKTVIVATGMNFPDALAGGPLAYVGPHPILLVRTDSVPAATAAAITNIGADEVIILGGPAAVSDAVATELEALTGNPAVRLAGDNRWGTAAEVADAAQASFGFPGDEVLLANGLMFADALAGGPLGGEMLAPIVLTQEASLPADTCTLLTDNNDVVANITALGLQAAIDDATLAAAAACAETGAPGSNQSFDVTQGLALNEHGPTDDRQYTVSGLDDDTTYTIALVPMANVTDTNGVITFADGPVDEDSTEEPDGRADDVCAGSDAVIDVVNGSDVSPDQCIDASPVDGTLTFTLDLLGTPGSIPGASVYPVVYVDANDDLELNVDATGAPTEDFGIGGLKIWVAPEAEFGTSGEYLVVARDPLGSFFVGTNDGFDTFKTFFLSDTEWQYNRAGLTAAGITTEQANMWLTDFETGAADVINVGDISTGDRAYNPDGSETMTFVLDTPYAVTDLRVSVGDFDTNINESIDNDARAQWTAATGGWIEGYDFDLYRETDTTQCDAGVRVTSWLDADGNIVIDDEAAGVIDVDTTGTQYIAHSLDDDDYCVVVTAITETADAGTAERSEPFTIDAIPEGDIVAPTSVDAFVRIAGDAQNTLVFDGSDVLAGDEWNIVFSEIMADGTTFPAIDVGSTIRVTDTDGDIYEVTCGEGVTCELIDTPFDWDGEGPAFGADRILRLTIDDPSQFDALSAAPDGPQYPLTITLASPSIQDTSGNNWDIPGSADVVLDNEDLTIFLASAVAAEFTGGTDNVFGNEFGDTITVTYDEDIAGLFTTQSISIDTDGDGIADQTYTDSGFFSDVNISIVGNTLTLTEGFFDPVDISITSGVSTVSGTTNVVDQDAGLEVRGYPVIIIDPLADVDAPVAIDADFTGGTDDVFGNEAGDRITVDYDEAMGLGAIPASITVDGDVYVESVDLNFGIAGDSVFMEVGSPLLVDTAITLGITAVDGSTNVEDLAGNPAVGYPVVID